MNHDSPQQGIRKVIWFDPEVYEFLQKWAHDDNMSLSDKINQAFQDSMVGAEGVIIDTDIPTFIENERREQVRMTEELLRRMGLNEEEFK